jgi:hypothetical protein
MVPQCRTGGSTNPFAEAIVKARKNAIFLGKTVGCPFHSESPLAHPTEDPWDAITQRISPLFRGEGLNTSVEELNLLLTCV